MGQFVLQRLETHETDLVHELLDQEWQAAHVDRRTFVTGFGSTFGAAAAALEHAVSLARTDDRRRSALRLLGHAHQAAGETAFDRLELDEAENHLHQAHQIGGDIGDAEMLANAQIQCLLRPTADRLYLKRMRGLMLPPVTTVPLATDVPTMGTVLTGWTSVLATASSALTAPIVHPYYVGGVFSGGVNTNRFARSGWTLVDHLGYGLGNSPAGYTGGGYPHAVEFVHYGQAFEMRFKAESGTAVFRVSVNGYPVGTTAFSTSISLGSALAIPLTFSTVAARHIRIDFGRSFSFGGIVIAGTDSLVAAAAPVGPQILILSDSYGGGANGVTSMDTWAHYLGRYLNADLWTEAQGGTGIVADSGGGSKAAYLPRFTGAVTDSRLNPDVVIVQASVNDTSYTSTLPAASAALLAQIRTSYPNALLVVTGILFPRGTLGSNMATINTATKTAATNVGADLFIDAIAEGWFTGNSTVVAPNGSGNSDVFMSSDSGHGTLAFHQFVGLTIARRIAKFFG